MVLAPVFYYNDENAKISSMKKGTSGTKLLILLMIRGTFRDTPATKLYVKEN